ncbi:MAG: hypothetical protein PHO37_05900 [Kiritimatiellae bacterium]|nr:hypothetical protein [Kiritimatiellia bacterium]
MSIRKTYFALTAIMVGFVVASLGLTVEIPDTYNGAITSDFVVGENTNISTNGVLIVFEGDLSCTTNLAAAVDSQGRKLASTQMYVQMKLFDTLPATADFESAQAAVLAVFNTGSETEGTLYALSADPTPLHWQQLTNNSAPMAVLHGATNLITIVLRYPEGTYTSNEYKVSISTPAAPVQKSSQSLASPVVSASGITKLSLVGEGALASVASAVGDPYPLSTSVDFSVYQSADGLFLVDIYTVGENGTDDLKVEAWIGGKWTLIGTAQAVGTGSNHYQITVSGLTVGEFYNFRVIDEEGRVHSSTSAIEVKSILMEAVGLELDTFVIVFNSEDGKHYKLLISSDVSAPLEEWTVEKVRVNGTKGWSAPMETFQGIAGGRTQISVPKNRDKAFFKVALIQ